MTTHGHPRPFPFLIPVLVLAAGASGAAPPSGEEIERRIVAELSQQNPAAVEPFAEANQARERNDLKRASELYARVREMAPGFDHAVRRQCMAEAALGNRREAIALCRTALSMRESAFNLTALGEALIGGAGQGQPVPDAAVNEAHRLARRAAEVDPIYPRPQLLLCEVAMVREDAALLERCVGRLEALAPEDLLTHYYAAILGLTQGRFARALAALDRARDLGLPEDAYRSMRAEIEQRTPWYVRYGSLAGRALAAWAACLVVLVVAAWILSAATLRTSRRLPLEMGGRASGTSAFIRALYRVVLWSCCAFYYASLPLVILTVLAAAGGLIYAFIALGGIPIKLVIIVAGFALVTVGAVLKGIFARAKDEDPGLAVDLESNPDLRELLSEVAAKVGTPPVDAVYLTPGTEVAVFERGGMLRQLSGQSKRCLLLGIGVLEGFRMPQLKAVLAHEYGHLSNRDTAGGGFALAVRRSLQTMAQGLAAGGAATWFNPAWLFLNAFYRVFLRISMGASRLQEILADRWAAFSYGAKNFEEGLRHVIGRSVRFGAHADAAIEECAREQRPLANIYTYRPAKGPAEEEIAAAIEAAVGAKPSAYDSHPSPTERFARIHSLRGLPEGTPGDAGGDAWALFNGREAIEEEMTAQIRWNVYMRYRVDVPAPPQPPRPAAGAAPAPGGA